MNHLRKTFNPRPDEQIRVYSGMLFPRLLIATFTSIVGLLAISFLIREFTNYDLSIYFNVLAVLLAISGALFLYRILTALPSSKEFDELKIQHSVIAYTDFLQEEGEYNLQSVEREIEEMQKLKATVPLWKIGKWAFINDTLPAFLIIKDNLENKKDMSHSKKKLQNR